MPAKPFDHKRKSWLVLWEAGVVIELPPWVFLAYPSSLLHHWNVDLHGQFPVDITPYECDFDIGTIDFKVVTTNGEWPTPDNSTPMEESGDGRATFVFFNQASMFQSSETGYDTLAEARADGHSGVADFGDSLNAGMHKWGEAFRLDPDM